MIKDYTGQKYGRLTAIRFDHKERNHSYWLWKCDCGNEKIARPDCVIGGFVHSCGCLNKENRPRKHGSAKTKLYHVYYGMKERCYHEHSTAYHHYGAKGVRICDEWLNSYPAFEKWAKENGYREGLSIDRIDYNGNYEPSNCRWVTAHEQTRNTSRNTWIEHDGERKLLVDWCEQYGVNMATACSRRKRGLSFEEVFKPTSARCND